MVVHRSTLDPYRPERGLYECRGCGVRVRSDTHVDSCADCGAAVRNIAVARE
jgi:rRNA maturation endonuclease Nob1